MKTTGVVLLAWAIAVLVSVSAGAEVPPRSDEDRLAAADLVVIGEVVGSYLTLESPRPGFVNAAYVLQVRVTSAEKGDAAAGKVVYVHTWKAQRRPEAWVGPGGQYEVPGVGQTARFFATTNEQGVRTLLLPNGIEPNPTAAAPTTAASAPEASPASPTTEPLPPVPADPAPADPAPTPPASSDPAPTTQPS